MQRPAEAVEHGTAECGRKGAEELGLGAAFLSERFHIKEAVTLSGAAGAVSSEIGIATAATNHNTRHPIVTASFATTYATSSGPLAPGCATTTAWRTAESSSRRASISPSSMR